MSSWSDERIELLKKLVPEGHSYSYLAERVSALPGPPISRNAAIGKATRMGINHKHPRTFRTVPRKRTLSPNKTARRLRIAPTSEAMARAQQERDAFRAGPDLITPPEQRLSLAALTETSCRFPYGEGTADDPFRFCGKDKVMGKPYCHGHCLRAFDAPQPRRRTSQTDHAPARAPENKRGGGMSQGSRHRAFVYVGKEEAVRRAMRRARPSEAKALAFISAGAAAGHLPSLAEISAHMGWRHPDSVVQFLRSLEREDRLPEGYERPLWTKPNRKPQLRRAASRGVAA